MEFKREGLVTIEMDAFAGMLWAPERVAEIERTRPGELLSRDHDLLRTRYIVEVRRTSKNDTDELGNLTGKETHNWTLEIESGGQIWRIPGPVWDRANQYRERIMEEARSATARENMAERLAAGTAPHQLAHNESS